MTRGKGTGKHPDSDQTMELTMGNSLESPLTVDRMFDGSDHIPVAPMVPSYYLSPVKQKFIQKYIMLSFIYPTTVLSTSSTTVSFI
jgi:hypothetical protein